MNVIVTQHELPEFQALCQDLATQFQSKLQWPVWTEPLVSVQCYEFEVADDTAVATWIAMARPTWVSDQWRTLTQANVNPSLKGIDSCH
jgi:NifB/MoaA-like Fe-S oxidoreductase